MVLSPTWGYAQTNLPPTLEVPSTVVPVAGQPLTQTIPKLITRISPGSSPIDAETQTVAVIVKDFDHTVFSSVTVNNKGDVTFTLIPSTAGGGGWIAVYAEDDLGAVSPVKEFKISVQPFVVNHAPAFTKGSDLVVPMSAGLQTKATWATNISAGPPGESGQNVHFIVTGFAANQFVMAPGIAADGTLTFAPAANVSGQIALTVIAVDDGGTANGGTDTSAPQTFNISIAPNAPPTFTKGNDITIPEDAGPQQLIAWATQLSAGNGEVQQQLTFEISGYDAARFTEAPQLDAQGTLTFTPAPNAYGATSVSVQARDDGGTANGGRDYSAATAFAITMLPVNDPPTMNSPLPQTVTAGTGSKIVTLTGITPGPMESDQVVSIVALSGDELLVGDPQITYKEGSDAMLEYVPMHAGTVTITITLTDNGGVANGGKDQSSYVFDIVISEGNQSLFVPTVFSPNGDQSNEVFKIRGTGIASLQLAIFDLSGRRVYYTDSVQVATEQGWDGRYNGVLLPAGSYAWALRGMRTDGTDLLVNGKKYGQVLLVR